MTYPERRDAILEQVDNPMNEDRWGLASQIADRLGWHRRGLTATLQRMEREGLLESRSTGTAPSPFSDAPPPHWRRKEGDNA